MYHATDQTLPCCRRPPPQADVMGVVHVGWATLDKRVREFSAVAAARLTLKEFEAAAAAAEQEQEALLADLVRGAARSRMAAAGHGCSGAQQLHSERGNKLQP